MISDKELLKQAVARGVTDKDQLRKLLLSNQQLAKSKKPTDAMTGLYNLIAKPTIEGLKGGAEWLGAVTGTLGGSMLSNSATGNATTATQEGVELGKLNEAIRQAKKTGQDTTQLEAKAKQLSQQNKQRYMGAGQISDAMLKGGENILSKTNDLRQRTGMEGSFDQGIMSGLKTAGVGTMKGAGGALAIYDLLGMGKAVSAGVNAGKVPLGQITKQLTKRGIRNSMINAPIYGAGNVAEDIRKTGGENLGQSAWEGISGSKPTGIVQGITGDTKYAPLVDTVISLGMNFSPYGKWTDKMSEKIVNVPGKAMQELKDMTYAWANKPNVYESKQGNKFIQGLAARVYGSSYNIPSKMSRQLKPLDVFKEMLDDEVVGTPDQVRERINKVTGKDGIFTKFVNETAKQNTGVVDTSEVKDVMRDYINKTGLLNTKEKRQLMVDIGNMLDQNQSYINQNQAGQALDNARQLEKEGWILKNQGTNIFNPNTTKEMQGNVYIKVAENITNQLDEMAVNRGAIEALKTPENIKAVYDIGGQHLVDKFLKADSWKALRSIQSPYVKMGTILDLNEAGNWSNVLGITRNLSSKILSPVFGGIFGGMPGAIAGTIVQPVVEGTLQTMLPKIQGQAGSYINKFGSYQRALTK